MSDEVSGRSQDDRAIASWQYPFNFSAALTIEPDDRTRPGYICRAERIFAAATPAWGLSQEDVAAARTFIATGPVPLVASSGAGSSGAGSSGAGSSGSLDAGSSGAGSSGSLDAGSYGSSGADQDRIDELHHEGVAEAFVELLRHEVVPPVPGFRVVRLVPPPEASGERHADHEGVKDFVIVGERVVVTWLRRIEDADNGTPRTLTHLDAVDFFGVPQTYGLLLWTAPSGREIPVAAATKYLPRQHDGWVWCVDLVRRSLGLHTGGAPDPWVDDFPARIGRHVAKLHVALATPSKIIPDPIGFAGADLVRAWHSVAMQTVAQVADTAGSGRIEGAGDIVPPRLPALTSAVDGLLAVADDVEAGGADLAVQTIHGDLHVGQVLRWPAGLAVIDFHPDPGLEFRDLRVTQPMQPAARDLARLLRSLDHVGRVVDKSRGFSATDEVDAWSRNARAQLLQAYRAELASAGRCELFDERLLAPFEAEQLCREIVYAGDHLPTWAYAPLGGLWQEYPPEAAVVPRGRHSAP